MFAVVDPVTCVIKLMVACLDCLSVFVIKCNGTVRHMQVSVCAGSVE
jgi:hypothetical protein